MKKHGMGHGKTGENMERDTERHGKRHGKTWKYMERHGETWTETQRHMERDTDKTWKDMEHMNKHGKRHGQTWKHMETHAVGHGRHAESMMGTWKWYNLGFTF